MHDSSFLINIGIALLAAICGGLLARALRLPVLIGYLAAGLIVGPYTPGIFASPATIHAVANLGVALLMFTVGVHFSLADLLAARRTALGGGAILLAGMIAIGIAMGIGFDWGVYGGLFLGCALSLSSTAVMMRILDERGEMGTSHGVAMMGILIVQDVSLVLMAALLPALALLASDGAAALASVWLAALKAALFLAVMLLLSRRAVPALMSKVARLGSQELFLLVGVGICLVAAVSAEAAGLGLALGAFIAGIVISETDYAHEVYAQIRPLRDVFAALFFVSIGMLLDPKFLAHHWAEVLTAVIAIALGKALLASLAVYWMGHHGRTAIMAGLGLAQIGEFSFVLAGIGAARHAISPEISGVILSAAVISLLLAPFLYAAAGPIYAQLNRRPRLSRWLNRRPPSAGPADASATAAIRAPVAILGIGRVGLAVSEALRDHQIPHSVVDYDGNAVAPLRGALVRVVYGDATSEIVLAQLAPRRLEVAVIALPEAAATERAIRALKTLAPDVAIIARVHRTAEIARMRRAGASVVIHGEFEAGTEMIRQSLDRLGAPGSEIDTYLNTLRLRFYREEEAS